jgi:hypothetical protein
MLTPLKPTHIFIAEKAPVAASRMIYPKEKGKDRLCARPSLAFQNGKTTATG